MSILFILSKHCDCRQASVEAALHQATGMQQDLCLHR